MRKRISLKRKAIFLLTGLLLFPLCGLDGVVSNVAFGQEMFIYPTKDQSQEQQEKDKFECYQWAKKSTGFDPMEAPRATAPPPAKEEPKGGVAKGAVRGGLIGLAAGAIADDAGKGAAIGAASGSLIGGMRRRDQKRSEAQAEEQWAQEQAGQYAQKRNEYNRAYAACLEGRGYTVK